MSGMRNRIIVAQAVNAVVVVLEAWAIGFGIAERGAGNFVFYTQCSNALGTIACAFCLVYEARLLINGRADLVLPRALRWLKYAGACCQLMTFLVVVAILAPMLESIGQPGYYLMFVDGTKPITHLIGPLLVVASYILLEADRQMTLRQSLVGLVPTLVYAAVAYPCNITRAWDGPYPFFQVWNMQAWQSVLWFIALLVTAFALCQIPRLCARRLNRSAVND